MDYEKLLNAFPGMAFKFTLNEDHSLDFHYCSSGAVELYGLTPSEFLTNPRQFLTFFSAPQWLSFIESLRFCAAEQMDWQLVLTVNIKGKNRIHQFYATPEVEGGIAVSWSGFITDITQQYVEQDSHLQNERLLSSLFDLSPLGIGLVNVATDSFMKTNSALQRLLSYSEAEFVRLGPELLLTADDALEFQRQKMILHHQHRFEPHETMLKTKHGQMIDVLINGMLLDNAATEPSYWIIIEDISDRKTFERQLIAEKNRAEVAALAKSNFLASMSHEIRTPLNGVLGMLDVLQQSQLSPSQETQIDIALNSGRTLLQLLNNILDFSKIDAGKLELALSNLNIRHLLEEICSPFAYLAKEKQLEFSFHFETDIQPWIRTDELRLAQVLNNLLSNALKFTHQGAVHLLASLRQQPAVTMLTIEIKDSGIGISAEQTEWIFDPFTQADASTTRQYGGTGLGLAICQQLSQLLGGGLNVESTPGVGSCFTLWLCVEPGEEELPATLIEVEHHQVPPHCHILLVDDNAVNCEVVRLMLQHVGFTVQMAHDGAQAIEKLKTQPQTQPVDLVLMDCMMPVMDGYQATAGIRLGLAGEFYRHLPIVALTANAMSGDKEKCLQAGMNGYLSKPVTQQSLLAAIATALHGHTATVIESSEPIITVDPQLEADSAAVVTQTQFWDRAAFLKSLGPLANMDFELLAAFVESLQKHQQNFQRAQEQQDLSKIQMISHSIKGSAGQVCCFLLADAAQQLNQLSKHSDWQLLQPQCSNFAVILTDTLSTLEQILQEPQQGVQP
jgi:PAS domain S-box-containing protein